MEFLTSTILSGVAWDGIKKIGSLTEEYIKRSLSRWIIDEVTCERIAKEINDMPSEYKVNDRFLKVAIEEDKRLLDIINNIKPIDIGVQGNGNNIVSGNGNSVGNTTYNYNYNYASESKLTNSNFEKDECKYKCKNRNELKEKIDVLLDENEQIFTLYGPTDKNKQDIFSEKADIWRRMCIDEIVPNNTEIVKLLDYNKELLNQEEKMIFIKFKIHAKGFEDNQHRKEHIAEYIQFPVEIYDILK